MSIRPRAFAAALACLPFSLTLFGLTLLSPGPARAVVTPSGVIYVSNSGNDANSGASVATAKKTIQAGANAVNTGGTVFVEPGTYSGPGNRNISFGPDANNPHNMVISDDPANGGTPANTIINLQGADEPAFGLGPALTSAAGLYGLTIENSTYTGSGGAVSIEGGSPTIQNCVFSNNQAAIGGAIIMANSNAVIRECTFFENSLLSTSESGEVAAIGGAIEIETTNEVSGGTYTATVTNCVFQGNSAQTDGAAIDVSNDPQAATTLNASITNCTFTQNTSTYTDPADPGGAIGVYDAAITVTNDILYNDTVKSGSSGGEITVVNLGDGFGSTVTASHDDIQQSSGTYPGTSNINQDPKFATNLDLAPGSPAINAGTTSVPSGVDISIDRTGRSRDSQPDLGAYEVLAPTANAQSVSVPFNTAKAVTLVAADPNVTPRALTYTITSNPAHGTLSGTAPNLTYTPTAGYHGPDSFTFKVNNVTYDSLQATVTLTVAPGTPTANAQSVNVAFNTAKPITLTGSDPDSPALSLTYAVATNPAHGTLSGFNAATGAVTYTPGSGYHGTDSFTFTANNGTNTSSAATVTLTVAAGVPTANAQSVTTAQNTAVAVTLTGTDPDSPALSLTYAVTTNPTHGTLSGTAPNLTYTPAAGYFGPDTFQFTVSNGTNTSSAATVSITVVGAPTANAQTVAVPFNTATGVTLTGSDPNSPPRSLTYTVTSNPTHGTLSGTAPNLTYTPTAGYHGPDSFTFKVNNGALDSNTATVSITVNQAVQAPTANAQNVTTNQDTAVGITLTGTDPNSPPRSLTYSVVSNPTHGTLSGTAPNLTYTPNAGYFGSDSFTFKVNNGTLDSNTATVSITVVGKPTANAQTVAVPFNTARAITLTGSDPNSPPRSLTYTVTTSPTHGTLSGTAPNLTYTPTSGYHGADSFTFTVNNGSITSSPATVTLNVAAGVPTANAQNVTTGQDTAVGITLTGSDPDSPALPLTYAITTNPTHGTLSGTAPNLTYTPAAGYFGPDTFQFTVSNGTNTSAPATVSLSVTQAAPATVSGTVSVAWGTAGTATLTTNADGLRLLPAGRSTDLPWLGITKLTLTLSRAAALSAGDVSVTGITVANYGPVTVSGSGTSYTLTLAQPISATDRVTLTVGNTNISTYTRRLDVLPGDVNDDGTVTSQDAVLVRNMFLGVGGATPTVFGDINGDGVVDVNDYNAVRPRIGTRLP